MTRFINEIERFPEDFKAKSFHLFEAKVTKRILNHYGLHEKWVEDEGMEFGLNWFHDRYSSFPIRMEVRNIKVSVDKMFTAMTKTEIWKEFIGYLDENNLQYAAFIIPCYGQGLYAFHSCWHLEQVPGATRLTRQAATSEKGIIFEPLDAFLESVKKAGWSS